jgi:ribonuclease III
LTGSKTEKCFQTSQFFFVTYQSIVDSQEKKKLKVLEKSLGYSFKKKGLLKRALTHKSYANEQDATSIQNNERLEFLGDAVLELTISEFIMERYPESPEGELSKLRAAIVNESQLADLAKYYDLGQYLYLGKGEEQTQGREKNSLLADAYEAILGAVYIDRGFKKSVQIVRRHYSRLLDGASMKSFHSDFKTELQEKCQAMFRSIPRYRLIREKGPDHEKIFEIEISIRGQVYGKGRGRSKKEAEQMAAQEALTQLDQIKSHE